MKKFTGLLILMLLMCGCSGRVSITSDNRDKTFTKIPIFDVTLVVDNKCYIAGVTNRNAYVKLYLDGRYWAHDVADNSGCFEFDFLLNRGINRVKVVALHGRTKVEYSMLIQYTPLR